MSNNNEAFKSIGRSILIKDESLFVLDQSKSTIEVIDMNLIEQLGGYEQANNKLLKMDKILKEVYYSPSDAQKANELRQALLEYRRQHNIYEVGDLIIDACIGNSVIKYHGGYDNHENWVSCFVRHATDAEIKAGKRRPELDSDTCSDIRNHVSPLTKVIDR